MVTDYGEGDRTDFILSTAAYARMARQDMAEKLFSYGVVNVEFKRISCRYYNYNLFFKVHEHSKYCQYLAVVPIYQPASFDITALQVWQVTNYKFLFSHPSFNIQIPQIWCHLFDKKKRKLNSYLNSRIF